jgi:hypothetical protein
MLPIIQPIPPNWALKNPDGSRYCEAPNLNTLDINQRITADNCAYKITQAKNKYGIVYDCDISDAGFDTACRNLNGETNGTTENVGSMGSVAQYPYPTRNPLASGKTLAPIQSIPSQKAPTIMPAPAPVATGRPVTLSSMKPTLTPDQQRKKSVIDYLPTCKSKLNKYKVDRKYFCDKGVHETCEQYNDANNVINTLNEPKTSFCLKPTSHLNPSCDNAINAVGDICNLPFLAKY